MRIAIIGNSGSGKSTLAAEIARMRAIASLDLDTVAWEPGQVAVPRDPAIARADLAAFCAAHGAWVVEGCYAGLVRELLAYRPQLLFLDPGVDVCLTHCRSRPWEPHKYKSKVEQDEKLAFLLSWVRDYYTRDGELSLRAHQSLFDGYDGPKQKFTTPPDPQSLFPAC